MQESSKLSFVGVLSYANKPSDKAPTGARGHRIMLTTEAVKQALPGLQGTKINYHNTWKKHDVRNTIGVIAAGYLSDDGNLIVNGYFDGSLLGQLSAANMTIEDLGMSYSIEDCRIADMRSQVWKITQFKFTSATIMLKEKAAYSDTSVCLLHTELV